MNVVCSVLYAVTISCWLTGMGAVLEHPVANSFGIAIGFAWFLYFTAYLFGDLKLGKEDENLSVNVLTWTCFSIQGTLLGKVEEYPILGLFGIVGVVLSSVGTLVPPYKARWGRENFYFSLYLLILTFCRLIIGFPTNKGILFFMVVFYSYFFIKKIITDNQLSSLVESPRSIAFRLFIKGKSYFLKFFAEGCSRFRVIIKVRPDQKER